MALAVAQAALTSTSSAFGARLPRRAARPAARRAPRPSPSQAIQARASTKQQAYICIDCGYIYDGSEGPFEKLPSSYRCPVCNAPKRRFQPYTGADRRNDARSMDRRSSAMQGTGAGLEKEDANLLVVGAAGGAVLLAALYFVLNSQF